MRKLIFAVMAVMLMVASAQAWKGDGGGGDVTTSALADSTAAAKALAMELDSLRAITTEDSIREAEARAKAAAGDSARTAVGDSLPEVRQAIIDSTESAKALSTELDSLRAITMRDSLLLYLLKSALSDSLKNRHIMAWLDTLIMGPNSDFKLWRKSLARVATSSGDTIEVNGPIWVGAVSGTGGLLFGGNGFQYGRLVANGDGNYEWLGMGGGTDWLFKDYSGALKVTITETGRITAVDSVFSAGYGTSSDRRLKADIENLPYGLKEIMKLIPRKYTMKGHPGVGFIAQEVEPVIPEAVGKGEDGYLNLSYDTVIPVLVKAVQEQQKEIQMLKFMLLVAVLFSMIAFIRTFRGRDK